MVSITVKSTLCIIGGLCCHLIIGSLFTWGALGNYLISYLRLNNPALNQTYAYFLFPLVNLFNALTMSFEFIHSKLSPRVATFLGSILMTFAQFGMRLTYNIFFCYLMMCVFGIGLGLCVNLFYNKDCKNLQMF